MKPVYFRNETFCDFYPACADSTECPRRLTQNIIDMAEYIGTPIKKFDKAPECFKGEI